MKRRAFLSRAAAAGPLATAGLLGRNWREPDRRTSPIGAGPSVRLEPVVDGLTQPLAIAFPSPDRRYVADKSGVVHVHEDDGLLQDPLLDVRDRLVSPRTSSEQGLVGLALHPDFDDNGRLFVRYSAPTGPETPDWYAHTFRLSAFRVTPDRRSVVPDSEQVLLEIPQPGPCHQSGAIAFGPDGYLYVGVGDGGSSGRFCAALDTGRGHADDWYLPNDGGNGQDVRANLLGSVLRIDVDGRERIRGAQRPYAIPDDNPLVGTAGLAEHYAWGLRNPYRLSFDGTDCYVGDVGRDHFEEVNRLVKGGNYGWNVREGPRCSYANKLSYNPPGDDHPLVRRALSVAQFAYRPFLKPLPACPTATNDGTPLREPVIVYPHRAEGEQVGTAVVGGYVYRNDELDSLAGNYVFGDLLARGGGRLFAAPVDPPAGRPWPVRELTVANVDGGQLGQPLLSFGRDPDGRLYILTTGFSAGAGSVYRVAPAQ